MPTPIQNRISFEILYEANRSNPNGDPDFNNAPRTDAISGHGIVTAVAMKHKIKNEISLLCEGKPGYELYVAPGLSLNERDEETRNSINGNLKGAELEKAIRDAMCSKYFDIRAFGAVMTSFSRMPGCASVHGPVQISMGQSISPVDICHMTVSRCATTQKSKREESGHDGTFGSQSVVSYALYKATGTIDPFRARITNFSDEDAEYLFTAMEHLFAHDSASTRANMRVRGLYIFHHSSAYGNIDDGKLFDTIEIKEKNPGAPVLSFDDYTITFNEAAIPSGIRVEIR